jgi:hypothetical protein
VRFDFQVLSVEVETPSWFDDVAAAYAKGGYDGVYLKIGRGVRLRGLAELQALPNLRYLEVLGSVKDDTAAFGLPALQELVLTTRCKVAVPDTPASGLEDVGIDDRPGKENLARLPGLRSLAVWLLRDPDLGFLRRAHRLERLHIEGTGQRLSLEGIEMCTPLEDVEILEVLVDGLRPLSGLSDLRRLWLIGMPDAAGDPALLDLEDLTALHQLEELRITYSGAVRSVQPLTKMPALRDIRLRGTRIADSNEAPS